MSRGKVVKPGSKATNRVIADQKAAASEQGNLRIGKRGIYLISGAQNVTSFRLIAWERLFATLRSGQ